MRVGFTGTKDGMTRDQQVAVALILDNIGVTWFHHGDCVGADAEAHELALACRARVVIHPPVLDKYRANCQGSTVLMKPRDYHSRNKDIVNETKVMVGTPKLMVETDKSGTWHGIRYARKLKRPLFIVWPDGTVTRENIP